MYSESIIQRIQVSKESPKTQSISLKERKMKGSTVGLMRTKDFVTLFPSLRHLDGNRRGSDRRCVTRTTSTTSLVSQLRQCPGIFPPLLFHNVRRGGIGVVDTAGDAVIRIAGVRIHGTMLSLSLWDFRIISHDWMISVKTYSHKL